MGEPVIIPALRRKRDRIEGAISNHERKIKEARMFTLAAPYASRSQHFLHPGILCTSNASRIVRSHQSGIGNHRLHASAVVWQVRIGATFVTELFL